MSQQQAELEQERLETTLAALERIREGKATPDDVEFLARELGVATFIKPKQEKVKWPKSVK